MSSNPILHEDLARIHAVIGPRSAGRFQGATVIITGCAGFLGYYFTQYFLRHGRELGVRKVIGLDTFLLDKPHWLTALASEYPQYLSLHAFDIARDSLSAIASKVTHGKLTYQRNAFGTSVSTIRADAPMPTGEVEVAFRYQRTDPKPRGGGVGRLFINGKPVGEGPIAEVGPTSMLDAFCIGRSCGTATGPDYTPPFAFNGTVREIRLDAEPAAAAAKP